VLKCLVILVLSLVSTALVAESYTFAVVPQHAASKIFRQWQPIITLLAKETGKEFEIVTSKDIPSFEGELKKGNYDFAYMNPYHFTIFNQIQDYQAIAKQKGKLIRGVFVVRKDSRYKTLDDLKGAQIAFPSPAAFAATLLPRGNLETNNIVYEHQFVSSHDSVYLSVANSIFDAGGGIVRTFNTMPRQIKENLRILWKSDGYTPHAIAAHSRISTDIRNSIQKALVDMIQSPDALKALNKLGFNQGFEKASNQDWDDVRRLNLQKLKP
jgi:phosphonate transport system substrate-binding protein